MEGNSITSFENLCKIFEMRIKLDREKGTKTAPDVLENYEKYSKKIDSIYNNDFQKSLKPLMSTAITLEKEEDRLRRLIRLLEERLEKREKLEDNFYNTTGKYITGLQVIISDEELNDKKQRLSLISRYLETNSEIKSISENIIKLRELLEEEEQKRNEYEDKNKILEDELYSSFMEMIKKDDYYKNIHEDEINTLLEETKLKVLETKETLDITKESIGSLLNSGLEEDYGSYIEEAEKLYFESKNKEIILTIYKLVLDIEDDFKLICSKREIISELLEEKRSLKSNLSITTSDELDSFEKVVSSQNDILDNEREVLENITNYTSRIKFKEERLEELNESTKEVEILSILSEYGLIETYDTEEVSEEISIEPEEKAEEIIIETYDPYRIVEVKDYPRTLNVGLAKLKGESVREKVNKKLNPKVEKETVSENIIVSPEIIEIETNTKETELNTPVWKIPTDTVSEPTIPTWSIPVEEPIPNIPVSDSSEQELTTNVAEETELNTPVWKMPTETVSESITPTWSIPVEEPIPNIPVLDSRKQELTTNIPEETINLPVWGAVESTLEVEKPIEEINSIDIFSKPEEIKNTNDMFWTPVSDSKLETKDFPDLNISFNNYNNNNSNNFMFPDMNNKGE